MGINFGPHVFSWQTANQCKLLELWFGVGALSKDTMGYRGGSGTAAPGKVACLKHVSSSRQQNGRLHYLRNFGVWGGLFALSQCVSVILVSSHRQLHRIAHDQIFAVMLAAVQ